MKKIKTNRCWSLDIEADEFANNECICIYERHDGVEDDHSPNITVPVEAIDELVLILLKQKAKFAKARGE